jgi:hypothetical protein
VSHFYVGVLVGAVAVFGFSFVLVMIALIFSEKWWRK